MTQSLTRVIFCPRQTLWNIWNHGKWKQALNEPGLICRFVSSAFCKPDRGHSFPIAHRIPLRCRHFHSQFVCTNEASVKLIDNYRVKFVEEENEYFHKYLEELEEYKEYLLSDTMNRNSASVDSVFCSAILSSVLTDTFDTSCENVLTCLKHLTHLPAHQTKNLFVNESFKVLCSFLTNSLSDMDDITFWEAMKTIIRFDFRRCITSIDRTLRLEIAKAFDEECRKRCSYWNVRSHLLAADFYYHFRCSAMTWSKYMQWFFMFMEDNVCDLSKTELVVLMFHVNLYRHSPESLLSKLSQVLHSNIHEFSGNDLGIITLGYFKSKTVVRNYPFLDTLIPVLQNKVGSMEDVCLSAVMKYLQRSTHKRMVKAVPHTIKSLIDLQPHLLPRMEDVKISTSLHIISMYENLHDITEAMLEELCRKLLNEDIRPWRIKDLARICKLLGNFSCPVPDKQLMFEKLVSELECDSRSDERRRFLDSLCTCLLGLSLQGIFPENLIRQLFTKEAEKFFQNLDLDFRRDLYHLSESVRIEVPDYTGPLLASRLVPNKKQNIQMFVKNGHISSKAGRVSVREAMMQDIIKAYTRILGGSEFLHVGRLLSHYQTPDIELRVHPCGRPVPVSKWASNGNSGKPVSGMKNLVASQLLDMATREPTRKIAVLLHGINAYYILRQKDGTAVQSLTGLHATKGRQLQKMGYEVVQIPHFEFSQVTEKNDYLKMKTFGTFFDDLD